MGLTKTEAFTQEQNELAAIAKALGHPARIAIIQQLMRMDTCICGDLVGEIPLAQPTISQHLKALKEVGVIKGTIEGTSVNYCIDPKRWSEIQNRFADFFATFTGLSNQRC